MDIQKVDLFILTYGKYFENNHLVAIKDRLLQLDDSKWLALQSIQFKDPSTSLIVSILAGSLGIDRFIIGDVGLGVAKLITCGGLGIWTIIDWFLIMGITREKNMELLRNVL